MITLALDASTKCTGYSIFDNKKLVTHGVIRSSARDMVRRVFVMTESIHELIEEYKVETVVMEEVRPDVSNLTTTKALMYLQAATAFLLQKEYGGKIGIQFTSPTEWRSKCGMKTGRGVLRDEAKMRSIEFVKEIYGITVCDDEAEAIGIGFASVREDSDYVPAQKTVIGNTTRLEWGV